VLLDDSRPTMWSALSQRASMPPWTYGWEWRMGSSNGVGTLEAASEALNAIGKFLNERLAGAR